MTWPTFTSVLNQAGKEVGLFASTVSDPFASTDKGVLQLVALLNRLGRRLSRQYNWTQLQRMHRFPTVSGQNHYPLPADYLRILNSTCWNRSTTDKVAEGASPQTWHHYKDSVAAASIYDVARVFGNRFYLHPEPSAAETLAFDYQSSYWVSDSITAWASSTAYTVGTYASNDGDGGGSKIYVCIVAGTSASSGGPAARADAITDGTVTWDYVCDASQQVPPEKAAATAASDVLWLDEDLLVTGLILEHKEAKGFDTTSAAVAFNKALAAALGGDGLASPLNVGGAVKGLHLIDGSNVPDTGYGV